MFNQNGLEMAWNWWRRICEHNLHLRFASPNPKTLILERCFFEVCVFHMFWNPKPFVSHVTWKISNGSRPQRRGLKSECVRNRYEFWSMGKNIEIWSLTFVYHQIMDLGIVGFFWFLESIFRLGNLGLGGWGNQCRDPGGTGPAGHIYLVLKKLSKNPLGKPS